MTRRLIDSPGTAVMISHIAPRYTQAVQCFTALQAPPGTMFEHFASGLDLAKAREAIATHVLQGDWLFSIDDDHLHAPDLLMRLLARLDEHPEVDIVSAYVLRRYPPHYSVAANLNPDGTARVLEFWGGGLTKVDLTGLGGGSVIRASAFQRVPQPWFTDGRFTEDWRFCERLKAVGGQAAVDLDCPVGHITPTTVWPTRERDEWGVSYVPVRDGRGYYTEKVVEGITGVPVAELVPA